MARKQVTVSAKVPQKLKEELERRGARLSDAIRKGLEVELKELKVRELESAIKEVDLSRIDDERIVRDIRETREEH
jgi:formiminotetrahydrofolate cyclodeaminase